MKIYKLGLLLLLLSFSSGCIVLHSGAVSGGPLLSRQDKYVDIANGEAKSVFVFGLGNLDKRNLVRYAKINMYFNRPLQKEEYYTNFCTSITNKYIFGFIHVTHVSVSADVLKVNDTLTDNFSSTYIKQIRRENFQTLYEPKPQPHGMGELGNASIVLAGDSIYYAVNSKDYKLFVVSYVDKESVLLLATNANDKNTLTSIKNPFFIKNLELNGLKSGNVVIAAIPDKVFNVREEGKVMGISADNMLVEINGNFYVLPPSRLKKIR